MLAGAAGDLEDVVSVADEEDPNVLPESEALALIKGSYDLVKAKLSGKMQREIDGAGAATKAVAKTKTGAKAKTSPKK